MTSSLRQIFAFSGVLEAGTGGKDSFALVEHAVALAAQARLERATQKRTVQKRTAQERTARKRTAQERAGQEQEQPTLVCYVPTAVGDAQAAIDFYHEKFARRADAQLSVLRLFPSRASRMSPPTCSARTSSWLRAAAW